jgi:ABC-type nickel/cobalt efflux system permease component RcnA
LNPDHLVAVSVFVSERKDLRSAAWLGISWGLGHTATLLLIGGGTMLLNITIPDWLAASMELIVGFLLIGIGLSALYRVYRNRLHIHHHAHDDGETHQHLHSHRHSAAHGHGHSRGRAFIVGLVHGGAGSAAAVLLVLSMVEVAWQGVLLIFLFGLGSIIGMLLVSLLIALATRWTVHSDRMQRAISSLAGAVSVALGLMIAYQYFFVG